MSSKSRLTGWRYANFAQAGRKKLNGEGFLIADIGTGSGCMAIALAKELPAATVYATDISPAALAVARRNAVRHGVADRIHFRRIRFISAAACGRCAESAFDLIVSNPPYIPYDATQIRWRARCAIMNRQSRCMAAKKATNFMPA